MIHYRGIMSWLGTSALLLGVHCPSHAVQYQPLVIPGTPGDLLSHAYGIGNSGVVLGAFGGSNPSSYFLWSKEEGIVEFGSDDGYFGAGPNASGQVAGGWSNGVGGSVAVVRDEDGTVRELDYLHPEYPHAEILAMSDTGFAVGQSAAADCGQPVVWDLATGTVTQIGQGEPGELGGALGSAAISATGYTAWTYLASRRYPDGHTGVTTRSFRRNPSGVVTELAPELLPDPWVVNVTNDGSVLFGGYGVTSWLWRPDNTLAPIPLDAAWSMSDQGLLLGSLSGRNVVLGLDGGISDLPLPDGASEIRVADINDSGVVAGWAYFPDSVRPVIWEPVPEPSSLAALSLGLLAAGAGVRRRRRE